MTNDNLGVNTSDSTKEPWNLHSAAEPEEVMGVLHEYHAAMGELILEYEGTLEHFAGDGMMIFFNDPVPWTMVRSARSV